MTMMSRMSLTLVGMMVKENLFMTPLVHGEPLENDGTSTIQIEVNCKRDHL